MSLSLYNFKSNPFLEERHTFPMIGRNQNWNRIKDSMNDLLKANSCGIMTIYGDYGMGKTFTLLKMKEEYDDVTKNDSKILSVFLKTIESKVPQNYLADMVIRSVRFIGEEKMRKLAKSISLENLSVDETLQNIISDLQHDGNLGWSWLIGRNLTNTELKEVGASYKISDLRESLSIFQGWQKFLKSSGYDNLVILFDEWEFLLSMGSIDKVRSVIRELQRVWDGYNETDDDSRRQMCKIIFVIGSSIGSWKIFLEMVSKDVDKRGGGGTETFMRRIPESGKITLTPLTQTYVEKFIINRLKEYREKPSSDELYPFTNDYVKFISDISMGIPSSILNRSALIVKEAEARNYDKIDQKNAKQILKDHGLLRELVHPQTISE